MGLSFVDLLYAVPIADLATRLSETHLHQVTPSGWADVAVALVALTFGWIGRHANYQQMPGAMKAARRLSRRKFTEYCLWDTLAIVIAKRASQVDWQTRAERALQVSAYFAAVFGLVLLDASGRPRPDSGLEEHRNEKSR